MDIFLQFIGLLARTPDWVALAVLPAAGLVAALAFALFGAARFYAPFACGLAACGSALLCAKGDLSAALFYLFASAVLFLLFGLLLFLPPIKRQKKESRAAQMYRKFHASLEETPSEELPPKVCTYEQAATAEESGMRLVYAASLMTKLNGCKLSPADRLELEALRHAVEACRGKLLTGEELSRLNDNLAAILKLTAKYKL